LVATAKPVYTRGKDLDIEVRSDIQIGTVPRGPHAGAPTISGGIHIPRGRINIQGQRFDFDHGDVTFNGSSEIDPQLDLKLSRQFPEALVVIELRGTPKKPRAARRRSGGQERQGRGDGRTRTPASRWASTSPSESISLTRTSSAPPTNANQIEAHVEYRMTRRMVMETVFGDAGQGGLYTLLTYRF
jgi:TamB, inner membrane protein subunit of TAM complex